MMIPTCPVCGGEMHENPYRHGFYVCGNCPLIGEYYIHEIKKMAALIEERRKEEGEMSNAMRRPCFEGSTEDVFDPDECQQSRYSCCSDPDCTWLTSGGKWETCTSGRQSIYYMPWREWNDTKPCDKCHGTGRVKK